MPYSAKDAQIRQQAKDWFVRLNSGDTAESTQAQFQQWLHSSALHAQAFAGIAKLWQQVGMSDAVIDAAIEYQAQLAQPRWQPERAERPLSVTAVTAKQARPSLVSGRWLSGLAATALLFSCWYWLPPVSKAPQQSSYQTAVAQVQQLQLADGSAVTLAPDSQFDVSLSAGQRQVQLERGQAMFAVAHVADSRFVVQAGQTEITVTGTRFVVSRLAEGVQVAVLQGSVLVGASGAGHQIRLQRGEQLVTAADGRPIGDKTQLPLDYLPDWVSGRLRFQQATLTEFLQALQPYLQKRIVFNQAELSGLQISTALSASQAETVLQTLPAAYPLRLIETEQQYQLQLLVD